MSVVSQIGAQLVKIGQRILGRALTVGSRIFHISSPEVYASVDSKTSVDAGFNDNVSVYAIVKKDAKKFASIPMYVYDAGKTEEKAIHPLLETKALTRIEDAKGAAAALTALLNRPNKYQSQDAFLMTVRAYFKVAGEAFIWLNRGDIEDYRLGDGSFDDMAINRLPVLEMHVLPSQYITAIPDPADPWGVIGWVLEAGERLVLRKDDVIHWKDVNLDFNAASRSHLRGMTPLTPGSKLLEESNSLACASMRMSQNDGAKAIAFNETMDKMSPTQQSDVKRVIDAKINNNQVAGSVALLQGKWGLLNLAMSSKDLEMIEKKKMSWQEMAFLFDVPNELFDTQTTFANKETAMLGWITNEMIPACKQFTGELNRVLPKAFGLDGSAFIGGDWSELPEVQRAMVEAAKTMQEIWSVAPDDVRQMLGFEPLGGDFAEPWVPAGGRTPMSKMDDGMDELEDELDDARSRQGY